VSRVEQPGTPGLVRGDSRAAAAAARVTMMDPDALFDAAIQTTSSSKRRHDGGGRDRDRDQGWDRDSDRDRGGESKRRKRDDDEPAAASTWQPGAPLPDQESMFNSAPPVPRSGGGRGGGEGGRGGGRGGGRRRGDGPAPEVFSVHQGEVRSIQSYGVFVSLPGFKDGLVHVSQMMSYRVEDPNDVVDQGQKVWVKVLEVDTNNKVSLSMKLVDQTSGRDEDPDNVEASGAQGRKGGGGNRGPIQFSEQTMLGSVKLGQGSQMGGWQYDLVGSDEEAAYQAEADMEAMWAMREQGIEDEGPPMAVPTSAGSGMGERMQQLLEVERQKTTKKKKKKKSKHKKKPSSKHKKKSSSKHKKKSSRGSTSSSS
jgi:predicted RNA-binding protein with RPS1 domain/Ni/Co efflux regulator RcnB